jgi:hypothetical protein
MPIPGRNDPETPRADARLLEFIAERRLAQARQRRQMIVLGASAGAALILLSVTVASLLFVRPPKSGPVVSPTPTPSTQAPPPPRAPDAARAPAPRAASRTVEPDRFPPAPPDPSGSPASGPGPATTRPATTTPAPATAPSGSLSASPGSDLSDSADPARRTASWLVQSYGRLEAENRAIVVAEFYSGERRAFWQRVLAEVRTIPDR